jgi:hypothetical protein
VSDRWLEEAKARVDDWSVADGYIRNDCERALDIVEAGDRLAQWVDILLDEMTEHGQETGEHPWPREADLAQLELRMVLAEYKKAREG